VFFLQSLQKQVQRLSQKVEHEKIVLSILPKISIVILEFAKEHGRVSIGEIAGLTGKSQNTLKTHFRSLVEKGHLEQKGGGRTSWYVITCP